MRSTTIGRGARRPADGRGSARRGERGLSLIEVVGALGLMGVVLISVGGLFVLSEKQVKSGKDATEALAVAKAIVEEMDGWGFRQTYTVYGLDGSAAFYDIDTTTNAFAGKWQTMLDEELAQDSFAIIRVEALPREGQAVENLNHLDTRAIRVTVTVNWAEGGDWNAAGARNRSVQVSTVRQ